MFLNTEEFEKELLLKSKNWSSIHTYQDLCKAMIKSSLDIFFEYHNINLYKTSSLEVATKKAIQYKFLFNYYSDKKQQVSIKSVVNNIISIVEIMQNRNLLPFPVKESAYLNLKTIINLEPDHINNTKDSIEKEIHNYWHKLIKPDSIEINKIPKIFKDILITIYFLKTFQSHMKSEQDKQSIDLLSKATFKKGSNKDVSVPVLLLISTINSLNQLVNNINLFSFNHSGIQLYKKFVYIDNSDLAFYKAYMLHIALKKYGGSMNICKFNTIPIHYNHEEDLESDIDHALKYMDDNLSSTYKSYVLSKINSTEMEKERENTTKESFKIKIKKNLTSNVKKEFKSLFLDKMGKDYNYNIWIFKGFNICKEFDNIYLYTTFWDEWLFGNYMDISEFKNKLNLVTSTFDFFTETLYTVLLSWLSQGFIPFNRFVDETPSELRKKLFSYSAVDHIIAEFSSPNLKEFKIRKMNLYNDVLSYLKKVKIKEEPILKKETTVEELFNELDEYDEIPLVDDITWKKNYSMTKAEVTKWKNYFFKRKHLLSRIGKKQYMIYEDVNLDSDLLYLENNYIAINQDIIFILFFYERSNNGLYTETKFNL